MTRRQDDLPLIKEELFRRIEELCRKLLPPPPGKPGRHGRLWVAHNPITADYDKSPEFKVALTRDVGAWKDWRTGQSGDVIGLIQYLRRCNFREALEFARDFTGIRQMDPVKKRELEARARDNRKQAAEDAEAKDLERMRQAERLWERGYQDGAGSTAEAMALRYFAARGIPLEDVPNRDRATFRFSAAQEFWKRAQYRYQDGRRVKVQRGPEFPCILSAMRLATGQVAAAHMTFLDPLGPRKLPVDKGNDENSKIMFGPSAGAVIRLTHGPEGVPPELATQAHTLIMGEGIETTLSEAIVAPEARAWAAGSLSNMLSAPIWLPCVSQIVLLRDHFKHKTTEAQWQQVCEFVDASGKPWVEIASHVGNDFNDLMKGDE